MRNAFCDAMLALADDLPYAFLTGDLGFMALEPLRERLGGHFLNAGVSEQNMISMAAGMASVGLQSWAYSIAPFCYARPFEQIRNDVCLNQLPVRLVGNGGGYGYGSMGATHHAIEDYGVLLALPGMRVYVPAFDADVAPMVAAMSARAEPAYLRLGRSEYDREDTLPPYAPWREMLPGQRGVLVVAGPVAGGLMRALRDSDVAERPALWVVGELRGDIPLPVPQALCAALADTPLFAVVEEHVAHGGLGQLLAHALALQGVRMPPVAHLHARGYPSGRYGSQSWHRAESGLDVASILAVLKERSGAPVA